MNQWSDEGCKRKLRTGLFLLILAVSLFFVAQTLEGGVAQGTVYVMWPHNVFDGCFIEPFEVLYLLMWDGQPVRLSTHQANTVNVSAEYIRYFLGQHNYEVRDIAIIIHNHFRRPDFTGDIYDGDLTFLKRLRTMGFQGSFGLYVTGSNIYRWIKPWEPAE